MSENRFIFFHGYLPVPAAARKKKFNELAKKTGSSLSSYPTIIIRGISIAFRAADIYRTVKEGKKTVEFTVMPA